jgi:hypothetical protein
MATMLDGVMLLWFILTAASVVFILWDQLVSTPSTGVMKVAWVLVAAYTGPVGLFVYLLSCRQPLSGTHDAYISAHWKQSVGSLSHCLSGDATGIVLAAVIVYHFGLANGWDLVVEYVAGFVVGLLIFQALFMRKMYDGQYWRAVRGVFFAETVSMNTLMIGMFSVMLILMSVVSEGDNPWTPRFWFIMSMAAIAGAVTAYPINSWMVARGIKHGMMSAPQPGAAMAMGGGGMTMGNDEASGMQGQAGGSKDMEHGAGRKATEVPLGQALFVMVGTLAGLIVVLAIVGIFVPIRFG